MKKLQNQLNSVSKSLVALSKKVESITKQVETLQTKQKAATKKKPAKKKPAKKRPAKKAPAKKTKARKKAPAKKAAAKPQTAKQPTVLESVYSVIKNSKAGTAIAHIKEKTDLNARQLSNALYKLAKQGKIIAESRGVYKKK